MTDYQIIIQYEDTTNKRFIKPLDLEAFCNSYQFNFYAFILHDCDVDSNGNQKTKHYHLVCRFPEHIKRNVIINLISSFFLVDKCLISVLPCSDMIHSIRYLCHLDDNNKFRYPLVDVVTSDKQVVSDCFSNNINASSLLSYKVFDINYLIDVCKASKSILEVYRTLGLQRTNQYKTLISNIWFALSRGDK